MDCWCNECKKKLEYEECEKSREWYEAWGHEFYEEYLVCPHCKEYVVPYEHQDREVEEMDKIADLVEELAENICDKFCKYSGTGEDGKCLWCQTHNNECPLDEIMEEVGLK